MAVLVTIDKLRDYTRSLDERLINTTKYPDSWVESKINTAYELVATKAQSFLKEDVIDLADYITDGTWKFEIEMDEDVVGWKSAFYMKDNDYMFDYPVASRFPTGSPVAIQIKPDNSIIVDIDPSIRTDSTHTVTFQYYFFPNTKTGDQYFSTDVYHMVRHAIASSTYDSLRDFEQRDNYDKQLAMQVREVVNTHDMDAGNVSLPNWNF